MMTELATNKKDNSFAEDASSEDISLEGLQQELEECKNHEVFDFIVQKLYAPRKPKTNIQILQQKVLLKYNVESLKESERRMKDKKTWSIIYIPDKPMAMSNQQPTVEVHACLIEPKHAHTIVRRLNHMAPLEDLRHVKRIQKKNVVGGKTELTAILCVAYQNGSELKDVPQEVQELIESYELIPFITKVCRYAALSKEEWEEQCKLWPTSYHPPTYNIDGITGFSDDDSKSICAFMKFAVELAKSDCGLVGNAAVIVDPSVRKIISSATDQIYSWHKHVNIISTQTSTKQSGELLSHSDSNGAIGNGVTCRNGSLSKPTQLHSASCLNPWQWVENQRHTENSGYWHPLRHAAIAVIESSAIRDRELYPDLAQNRKETVGMDHIQLSSLGSSTKRQKTNLTNVQNNDGEDSDDKSASARPYLCTGYDIYLVWEPCIMCAMALVHQRIRRIFYAFPNPSAGALGSVHRLQGEKSLNHHYAVFNVAVPEEVLDVGDSLRGNAEEGQNGKCL